MPIAYS